VNEKSQIMAGALIGAFIGAAATYLFWTEGGRQVRDRMEPALDNLRSDFYRFKGTLEKLGDMANEGMRVVNEFQSARGQSYGSSGTSH
jgi:gas vesicle protein